MQGVHMVQIDGAKTLTFNGDYLAEVFDGAFYLRKVTPPGEDTATVCITALNRLAGYSVEAGEG